MPKLLSFIRPYFLQPKSRKSKPYFSVKNFFFSFADSLLFLLHKYDLINQSQYALLPDFYCPDTLKFINRYLKIVFYKINNDFTVDKESYFSQIEQFHPSLIINYSFLGNFLTNEEKNKLSQLAPKAVIVEDCAHRIILAEDTVCLSERHYYIDSIRKHGPILGSHLIGQNVLQLNAGVKKCNAYKLKCQLLQFGKGFLNGLAYILNSQAIYNWADELFMMQDNIIGWPTKPVLGNKLAFYLYNSLDLKALQERFFLISNWYQDYFSQINNPQIKTLPNNLIKTAELAYYPLFVAEELQEGLVLYLRKHNIFAERLWEPDAKQYPQTSNDFYNSFIIFPISWLIKEKDIAFTSQKIQEYLAKIK